MIFVTLGSQKFQFNRLLKKIDELVASGEITDKVFAQIGYSDYIPQNYEYTRFLDRENFFNKMRECDVVLTHGGTGVIINAVKQGKKVIAVPRKAQYGEHVDDHQVQIIKQFEEMGIIYACYEVDDLNISCLADDKKLLKSYQSNTQVIIHNIEEFINTI